MPVLFLEHVVEQQDREQTEPVKETKGPKVAPMIQRLET